MPAGRSYTSYDVYRDYNSEDLLDEMYPPMDGSYTPQPEGRAYTPLNGLQNNGCHHSSSGRPASKMRPPSRQDVTVQTESKRRTPLPETQRSYNYTDSLMRPTSPVQRMLERSKTQPYMSLQGPLPGADMDPFTKQYYHRQWQSQTPTQDTIHLNRQGRAGGQWRHVRACQANTGTQLAFIDGTVKQEDNIFFPQHRVQVPRATVSNFPAYMAGQYTVKPQKVSRPNHRNTYSNHAKSGFKYWYQEKKPIDLRGSTTRLRARMVGNGY